MSLDSTNRVAIEEDTAFKKLCSRLRGRNKYDRIVTTGRGGLSVAQKLAYLLDIPVYVTVFSQELRELNPSDLFVDDIVCTGSTIGSIPRFVDIATLVHRKSALYKPTFTGLVYEGDEYITFSWEADTDRTKKDIHEQFQG